DRWQPRDRWGWPHLRPRARSGKAQPFALRGDCRSGGWAHALRAPFTLLMVLLISLISARIRRWFSAICLSMATTASRSPCSEVSTRWRRTAPRSTTLDAGLAALDMVRALTPRGPIKIGDKASQEVHLDRGARLPVDPGKEADDPRLAGEALDRRRRRGSNGV